MCTCHSDLFPKRRRAFLDLVAKSGEDAVCFFPAAPVFTRNNDVEHDYRQDSDLFYLTGFGEPGSALVLDAKAGKTTMFVRPRDADWTQLRPPFGPALPGERQLVVADIESGQTSCGFAVPLFGYAGDRPTLNNWAEKKGPEGIAAYWAEKNAVSIDGLPTGLLGS